jgi:hypothetical protein
MKGACKLSLVKLRDFLPQRSTYPSMGIPSALAEAFGLNLMSKL